MQRFPNELFKKSTTYLKKKLKIKHGKEGGSLMYLRGLGFNANFYLTLFDRNGGQHGATVEGNKGFTVCSSRSLQLLHQTHRKIMFDLNYNFASITKLPVCALESYSLFSFTGMCFLPFSFYLYVQHHQCLWHSTMVVCQRVSPRACSDMF